MTTRMDWERAGQLLAAAQHIIVLTHIDPDGDAFGSMLGLAAALRDMGKTVATAVDGGLDPAFRFLPGADAVEDQLDGLRADLVIVTDCSDERRIGEVGKAARALGVPIVNVDHHRTNTYFGDAILVDASTVAASEGVLDWLDVLGAHVGPAAAQCLLTGIVTDTLCFRTSNVTERALGKAQRLMQAGGNLGEIVARTVNRTPAPVFMLWRTVMPRVRLEDHVIWASISQSDFHQVGIHDEDDGHFVSLLMQVDQAYVACVLTEREGGVDLSIRSVPGFDVSAVALALGGGGHTQAAGATLTGLTLAEAEAQVIPLLHEAVRAGAPLIR